MKKVIAAVGAVAVVVVLLVVIGGRHCGTAKSKQVVSSGSSAHTPAAKVAASQRTVAVLDWLAQLDVKPRKVAGHVVFAGKPVAGAVVRLALDAGFDVLQPVAEVKSGPDGAFDFGPQPAARFNVSAEAPQRTPAQVSIALADPSAKPDQIVLELGACTSRLYGTVLDASGGAIAKAHLRAAGLAGTETDTKGEYSLCVAANNSQVRVEADGYGTIAVFIHLFGELKYDFVLVPEAVLVGQVVTEDKRPVAGARVVAIPDPGEGPHHIASGWALSEDDGRFRIPGLSPGHYRVTALTAGLGTSAPVDAMVQTGTAMRELIVVVTTLARVSGHVVMGDHGVAGAHVMLTRGGPMGPGPGPFDSGSGSAFSQADGSFVVQGAPLGVLSVGAIPYDVVAPKQIDAKAGKVDNVKIEVAQLAALHGTITRKGKPVAGAHFEGDVPPDIVSDANGAYRIPGLRPPEVHFLTWSVSDKAFARTQTVKITAGEDKQLDIDLDCAGEVKGIVVDESGKPVPGVYVRMMNDVDGDLGESMTDAQGQFDAASMFGGDYQPSVYPSPMAGQPFAPATGDKLDLIKVPRDGVVTGIKLAIKYEMLAIRGTVVDDAGAPVADVHIEAIGRGRGGMDLPSIMSAANGSFAITRLARGTYNLHAHGSDGSEGDAANIEAGTDNVVIKLVRPGAIEGTLVGFSTPPTVQLLTLTTNLFIGSNPIVEGTRFSQTGLRPGRYAIEAKAGMEVDGATVDIRAGETAKVTLRSRGVGKLEGHLFEFGTKTPLPGYRCDANLSMGGQMGGPPPDPAWTSNPDASGHFAMAAPIGMVRVFCFPQGAPMSPAGTDVEVTAQTVPNVEVYGVKVKRTSPGDAGFRIKPLVLPLVVVDVTPNSSAATQGMKPGDLVTSIDGAAVQGLLPAGAMTLIGNHAPGSTVTVGIARGGTALTFKLPVVASPD
jgi:hypothetical protein